MRIRTLVSPSGVRLIGFPAVLGFITVVLATVACSNGDATATPSVTWSRIPRDETVLCGEGPQAMNSVIAGGPGLVAVGLGSLGGDADAGAWTYDAAAWTSADGITWSRIPRDESVFGGEGFQLDARSAQTL